MEKEIVLVYQVNYYNFYGLGDEPDDNPRFDDSVVFYKIEDAEKRTEELKKTHKNKIWGIRALAVR